MNERDFSIGNLSFRLNKIDAMAQFHLVRRMAPILGELLPTIGEIGKGNKKINEMSDVEKLDQVAKFVTLVMNGLSKLNDEDSEKVLFGLLASVEMQQSSQGGYARLVKNGQLMFMDFNLAQLFQIAGRAFMYNLSNFFAALPQTSSVGD